MSQLAKEITKKKDEKKKSLSPKETTRRRGKNKKDKKVQRKTPEIVWKSVRGFGTRVCRQKINRKRNEKKKSWAQSTDEQPREVKLPEEKKNYVKIYTAKSSLEKCGVKNNDVKNMEEKTLWKTSMKKITSKICRKRKGWKKVRINNQKKRCRKKRLKKMRKNNPENI